MYPPIEATVKLIRPKKWALAHDLVVERVATSGPDVLKTWVVKGETYCVRQGNFAAEWEAGESVKRFGDAAPMNAIYLLGEDMVCKVVAMWPKIPTDADAMRHVRQLEPTVPMPELYFDHLNPGWERHFTIMERVHGRTLHKAWMDLSLEQIDGLAQELVGHVLKMAKHTAPLISSTREGLGSTSAFLLGTVTPWGMGPSWAPLLPHPKMDHMQLRRHWEQQKKDTDDYYAEGMNMAWIREDEPFSLAHVSLSSPKYD